MRSVPLVLSILIPATPAFAGEIREFDLKTIERLGNELTVVSQRPDRGATNAVRKRAIETAKAALAGRLYNIRYDYVVLDDPDGTGFLVYALGSTGKRDEVVVCGHFRVTVSGDGERAERIDALSRSLLINKMGEGLPRGTDQVGMGMAQIVSEKPVETLVYTNRLTGQLIVLKTFPHGQVWVIENGKIEKDESKK
jgi:hypothetical protein